MTRHLGRTMFVNATENEVRSLLEDIDCLPKMHVINLLAWVRGTRGWSPDAAAAVRIARRVADNARAQDAC